MKHSVSRIEYFNAAHRLHNPDWTDQQNYEFYGLCNNANYHGHNDKLIATIIGELDNNSGYLIDLKEVSQLIKNEIVSRFDHRNLNLDCIELQSVIPTTENMCTIIYNLLRPKIPQHLELQITIYETNNNFVTYPT